ncbi:ribbon-helix-helix domain-containing protein (plasmid) [Microtetraspora malaysiensis]|uniref:ribbon-helix-helix domain-containing protein n=1 Tax=Microtetraspora malaysiensis TaxID=161358 RepID=UPI003D90E37B
MAPRTKKITITVPEETADALKRASEAGEIPSVSEYVAESVNARFAREQWLKGWRERYGTPTPEQAAWANGVIDEFWGADAGQERRAS